MLAIGLREGTKSKREVVRSVDEWLMNMDSQVAPDNLARQPANQEIP
jgi:hypothetical protein